MIIIVLQGKLPAANLSTIVWTGINVPADFKVRKELLICGNFISKLYLVFSGVAQSTKGDNRCLHTVETTMNRISRIRSFQCE